MTTLTQPSLFDLPTHTYNDHAPYRASETSAAGAVAIEPKRLSLQSRVLLALHAMPGLTHAGLDRYLGTTAGRSARPRCTELKLAGYVEEIGQCTEESGIRVSMWGLTRTGEALARELRSQT